MVWFLSPNSQFGSLNGASGEAFKGFSGFQERSEEVRVTADPN